MKGKTDIPWEEFDPSNDEEFQRNLELAFLEEEPEEKIELNHNEDIQWIDIEASVKENEKDLKENEKDLIKNKVDVKENGVDLIEKKVDRVDGEDKEGDKITEEQLKPVDEDKNTFQENAALFAASEEYELDDFEQFEKAVHSIVSQELTDAEEEVKQTDRLSQEEEAIISEITRSLAKQIEPDFPREETVLSEDEEVEKYSRFKKIGIPILVSLGVLLLTGCMLLFTKTGQTLLIRLGANIAATKFHYDDGSEHKVELIPEITDAPMNDNIEEKDKNDVQLNADDGTVRHEEYAVNILLLGEEAIESGGSRGRTDVMMIATLNSKEKSIKLTSLMRDMYVQIPGFQDDKLNSAYAVGGIPMLIDTIELNFDLKLDGYCLVGFQNFEKIIDQLGGIEITLTASEANWLNSTNYISNPKYRTVVAGLNHMNGNQALGFCRIRDVASGTKEHNDFGRTSRHRTVLDAIFNKYKTLNYFDLAKLMIGCLPMVTTDLDAKELETYMKIALEIGLTKMEQLRIPVDGAFEDAYISKKSVIIPNLQKNVEALHEFVFGAEE